MNLAPENTRIDTRRPFGNEPVIYLIGPGGVGKSRLGAVLAERLTRDLIDLDHAFMQHIGHIGRLIEQHGYDWYASENSRLARTLVAALDRPAILVTSSGFLASPGLYADNLAVVQSGYSITLLPSLDIDHATAVVVERQLQRGFGFERAPEIVKFRQRFELYRQEGDMLVTSTAEPATIADAVMTALSAVP